MADLKKLTAKEEEILSCFWEKGPMFIRELLEAQEDPKPHYNTLSTIVRVLEEKGYIGYKAYGNTYQYFALVSREEYCTRSLKTMVNKHFGNSYKRVVSSLIEEEEISVDELQELIEEIKSRQKPK